MLVQIAWVSAIYIIQIGTGEGGTGTHVPFWTTPNAHNSHVVKNTHCKLQLQSLATSNVWSWKVDRFITWFASEKEAGHSYFQAFGLMLVIIQVLPIRPCVGSNRTNADNDSTSEILPAEAAAIEVETSLHQSNIMLHSNYCDSFLSNPKTWQDPSYSTSAESKSGLLCQGWYSVCG